MIPDDGVVVSIRAVGLSTCRLEQQSGFRLGGSSLGASLASTPGRPLSTGYHGSTASEACVLESFHRRYAETQVAASHLARLGAAALSLGVVLPPLGGANDILREGGAKEGAPGGNSYTTEEKSADVEATLKERDHWNQTSRAESDSTRVPTSG